MKRFNIEVTSKKPEKIDGLLSHWGRITIGDFSEEFVMPLNSWTLDQYKQQWQNGLEQIKNHDFSCLVVTVQNLESSPLIETWNLYKDENKIFIQNSLLINETVEHKSRKLSDFNANNCYEFIDYPKEIVTEDGKKISEWNISTKDFFSSLETILK